MGLIYAKLSTFVIYAGLPLHDSRFNLITWQFFLHIDLFFRCPFNKKFFRYLITIYLIYMREVTETERDANQKCLLVLFEANKSVSTHGVI